MVSLRKPTVSLCMIVRNEERNLGDCLEPIAELFDEIVIVDTGSQDSTKQIAQRFTNNVFDFPWRDDFSAARNESLSRSSGDWIFWLDADDRIRADNVLRLRNVLGELDDRARIYCIDTIVHGPYASEGSQLQTHPRLFRRHADLHWCNRVHEQLRPAAARLGYETVWSDVQIDHLGYQDAVQRQRKLQHNLRLLRMDYAADPQHCSTVMHLGLTCAELGIYAEAKKHFRSLLARDDGADDCMERVYRSLADLSLREGDVDESLSILARGLSKYPRHEGLLFLQASFLFELGRFDETRVVLEQIIAGPAVRQHHGVPSELKRKLAPRKLADVFRLQKRFDLAEIILRKVLQDFPTDTHAWYALGCVYGDTDQKQSLEHVIKQLPACPEGDNYAAILQAAWHLQEREFDLAGTPINRLISEAADLPLPRVLRCQWLDQVGAPLAERIQGCRDLLRVQPANPEALRVLQLLERIRSETSAAAISDWYTSVLVNSGSFDLIRAG